MIKKLLGSDDVRTTLLESVKTLRIEDGFEFMTLDKKNMIWVGDRKDAVPWKFGNIQWAVEMLSTYGKDIVYMQYTIHSKFEEQDHKLFKRRINTLAMKSGYKVKEIKNEVRRGIVIDDVFVATLKKS